jgi:hypothetical protein
MSHLDRDPWVDVKTFCVCPHIDPAGSTPDS